jgi:hypothetical protein
MRAQYKILSEKYVNEIAISPEQDPRLNPEAIERAKFTLMSLMIGLLKTKLVQPSGNYEKGDGTLGNIQDVLTQIKDAKDGYEVDKIWDDSNLEIYTGEMLNLFKSDEKSV